MAISYNSYPLDYLSELSYNYLYGAR